MRDCTNFVMQNKDKSIALKTMEDGQVLLYGVSCSVKYPIFLSILVFL